MAFPISFRLLPIVILMVLSVDLRLQAEARPLQNSSPDLEREAWIAEDTDLMPLEQKIVREIQRNPRSAYYHYILSHVYVRIFALNPSRIDLLQKASALADQAIQLSPQEEYGYLALADIMDIMGKPEHSITILTEAKKSMIDNASWRIEFAFARLLAESQGFETVLSKIDASLKMREAKKDIVIPYVITVLQASYEKEQLETELIQWNKNYPHPLFDLMRAISLTELGHYEKAHLVYKKLEKQQPNLKEAVINNAVLLYKHLGQVDLAYQMLTKALKDYSGKDDMHAVIRAHLGSVALVKGQFDLARTQFISSISSTPQKVATVEYILNEYKKISAFDQLALVLEDIVIEVPGHAELYALLGELYSEKLGNQKLGARNYRNAVILNPENGQFLTSLGLIYYKIKDYDKAIHAFNEAVRINPDDSIALYNKACVLALIQRSDEALFVLNQAIKLNPRLQKMAQEDNDFISVKDLPHFRLITHERQWN